MAKTKGPSVTSEQLKMATEIVAQLTPMARAEVELISAAAMCVGENMAAGGGALLDLMNGTMPVFDERIGVSPELAEAAIAYAKIATSKQRGRFSGKKPRKKK